MSRFASPVLTDVLRRPFRPDVAGPAVQQSPVRRVENVQEIAGIPIGKLALVMDPPNLWVSHRKQYGAPLPLEQLVHRFQEGPRRVVFAVACIARCPDEDNNRAEQLRRQGFEVRERLVNCDEQGMPGKTNCDAEVGFALAEAGAYADDIVLFGGDGDFTGPVSHLRARRKRVYVVAFEHSAAQSLKTAATHFISADEMLGYQNGRSPSRSISHTQG